MTQAQLVTAVKKRGGDLSQPQLSAIENGDVARPGALVEIAAVFGVFPEWLLTGEGIRDRSDPRAAFKGPDRVEEEAGLVDAALPGFFEKPSLPPHPPQKPPLGVDSTIGIYSSAQGGDEGAMILSSEPVALIKRPPLLDGVVDGYAVYISGDSMSPAYEAGDLALVNPSLPPRPGNYCIFQGVRSDGSQLALIKRVVRETSTAWSVKQYEPAKTFQLQKSQWARVHVVVGKYERV